LVERRSRSAAVHRRSQPAQAGPLPARLARSGAAPEDLLAARPDYVLILPWNLRDEILGQMRAIGEWGGRFVVAVPELEVIEAPV
jgi:hypothetical protein